MLMRDKLIEDMKKGIKDNSITNKILQDMVDDGISEEDALDIMIFAWLKRLMMTEKRFIRIKNENGISIKDTKTGYERYYAIEVLDDLNELAEENEQLREALKNSYNCEICENCEYARYESYVDFEGFEDCDFECLKGKEYVDGLSECDDFKLKIKSDRNE